MRSGASVVSFRMDVLDVYQRPYDPKHPLVCLDETCKQLIGETQRPLPVAPGCPARYHHEYVRNGVANVFMMLEPFTGRSHVRVSERRTMRDWAHTVRDLVDVHYPEAEEITLVIDNLSTHKKAALYEVFEPEEAKRIADTRHPLHPGTRQLAQHGRDRTERALPAMPQSSHRDDPAVGKTREGLAHGAPRKPARNQLAFHDGGCTNQAQATLPRTAT